MIGYLKGFIIEKRPPLLLIDVHGVGYEVFAPMSTFYQLPNDDDQISLHTHLVVREDAQQLYGFYTKDERELFRALIKVNGIGPKLALTILSGIEPHVFVQCIQLEDASRLTNIPGIGKKTAERLVIETRDRLKDCSFNFMPNAQQASPLSDHHQDAFDALVALGYKPQHAQKTLKTVYADDLTSEQLIRLALQEMVSN